MLEENKTIVKNFLKALGSGDLETFKSLISQDIVAVCTGTSVLSTTRDYKQLCLTAESLGQVTKSGIDFKILCLTAENDRVACEVEGYSTLVTGSPYNNQYHFLMYLRGGKIYKIKEYLDTKKVDAVLGPLMQPESA